MASRGAPRGAEHREDADLAGCEKLQTLWLSDQLDAMNRPVLYMKPGGVNPHSVESACSFSCCSSSAPWREWHLRSLNSHGFAIFLAMDNEHEVRVACKWRASRCKCSKPAYCERLGAMFIVNSPFFFSMLYSCMSPFMSARTKAKIRWISGDEVSLRAQLAEVVTNPDERLFSDIKPQ
jgi:hypothetical protein